MGDLAISLNGVDRTAAVEITSLAMKDSIRARGSTAEFTYRTIGGSPPAPQGGNEVVITNGGTREFAGHLLVPTFEMWRDERGRACFDFQCQCVDYTWQLEKFSVFDRDTGSSKIYPSQAAGLVLTDVIQKYTDGQFTTSQIQSGLVAQEQEYDGITIPEIGDRLARETGYIWRVDFSRNVQFFAVEQNVAPIATLDLDSDTRVYDVKGDNGDASQVKNVVLLKDLQLRDPTQITEVFTANGVTRFFPLSYPVSPKTADLTLKVGAATWTALFDDRDGFSPTDGRTSSGTGFLCVWNRGIRLGSAPPNGTIISATYNRTTPRMVVYRDPAAIADMATRENRSDGVGDHEYVFNTPAVSAGSTDTVEALARLVLTQYARPRIRIDFKTQVPGWQSGQYLQAQSAGLNLNRRMYVQNVVKKALSETTLEYAVSLSDHIHGDD